MPKYGRLKLYQVDAFTEEMFRGNPAGVCLPEIALPADLMQDIALEMNLSETAFPVPVDAEHHKDARRFKLRWFTPAVEVPLCGHATLATSHVIFNELGSDADELVYESMSGPLKAVREAGGIRLDFPLNPLEPVEPPGELLDALRVDDWVDVEYCEATQNLLVRVKSAKALADIEPDFTGLLRASSPMIVVGVVLTSPGEGDYDLFSRYICPWVGIDEDPVTGLAHTMLADYWSRKLGKDEMRAYQASHRGGELLVRKAGERVHLVGQAVTVFETWLDL